MAKVILELKSGEFKAPSYVHKDDAGMDVIAVDDIIIPPGETVIVPTGLKMVIPEGCELQVRPRSGIAARTQLIVPNSPGTIDANYRGEIGVIVHNNSRDYYWNQLSQLEKIPSDYTLTVSGAPTEKSSFDYPNGSKEYGNNGTYIIRKGERIAQIVLCRYERIEFERCDDISVFSSDREGKGFGSTGI